MQLEGKTILITGASRGIGEAIAIHARAAGARPILVARSKDALEALASRLDARAYAADLSEPGDVEGLIDRVERDCGGIDVLVNNAAIQSPRYFLDTGAADVERAFRTNVLSPMRLCREVLPRMLSRGGGHVVNVSSVAAIVCFPGLTIYSATKAALAQFTGCLRADLRGLPVGVTLVELGGVDTDMATEAMSYGPMRAFGERAGGAALLAPPEQIAGAILEAVREDRRHVRLPAFYEAMCEQADRPRADMEAAMIALDVPPRP